MATSTIGIGLVSIPHVHVFNPIDGWASSDAPALYDGVMEG